MDEARLVFVDGVFPTDVTSHLAQLQQVSGASTSDDGGERAKVVAIVARHQHLEALPADLPYLPSLAAHLRELDLSLNRLTELPAALSCLERLEYLNLGHNAFAQVPALVLTSAQATTGGGGGLRHLFLGGNRLTSLPAELARLTRLENLSLGHNQFDSVPPVVYALTSLLSLSLNHNAIAAVDDGNDDGRSFARLSRLRTLDLSHNALTELALDVPRSLTSLDVSANTGLTTLALMPQLLSAKERKPAKLKRLDVSRCGLGGLSPTLAGFGRLAWVDYADNPWDDAHAYLRTRPLPAAVLAWLRIRGPAVPTEHAGAPLAIPPDAVTLGSQIDALENRYSLLGGRMSSSGEECTVKVYADDTPAETIAHEFSVLQTLYAGRDDSPLVGISFRPGQLPWLVFRKCLVCHVIEQRSLETHVKGQQLSVEERAQMAYHAAEAVDALLAGIDANFPEDEDERLTNERASLLALLYRDIQQSHHWLVQDPLDLLAAAAGDDRASPRWSLAPLPSSSLASSPQLVYAVGLLLHTVFAAGHARNDRNAGDVMARRPRRLAVELPLAVRQLLEWTWEWEKEAPTTTRKRRQPHMQPRVQVGHGERRPVLQDVMWLCFWLGHERTRVDATHGLGLRDFGPQLVYDMERADRGDNENENEKNENEDKNESEEGMDEETRNNLLGLFAETQRRVSERAMTLRSVKKEQKREQYWQVSHADLYSDDDDDDLEASDDDSDDSDDNGEASSGQGGLLQLQAMLANITNSFRDMTNA
ncbi:leucine rich repeat domain containing protein [Acanthamoeba castellanii str. Neff]|uniref:Leucine rich repeat domain containing protein n=1 Tax=Acanthamoeba castellanii (strain ATCC 30010 / Neff) TaxID=1257118 RepID=L8GX77_ACACF|nr:leucine rich repeat domain containing protein [Acanthamoeba castellanii str. Neff]ELR17163.1 leucine rich repeat domain containing protein [Acanthamoeba castellanii str. Neff]